MRARTLRSLVLLTMMAAFAGCTRPKATEPATPVVPAASSSPVEEESPAAFPSEAAPTPTPTPTPTPGPRILISQPTTTTDFSAGGVAIAFTATAEAGRKVTGVRVLYDGRELAKLDGEGPSFRVEGWDPNVENNLADPPLATPVRSGEHTLTFVATDDKDGVTKLEVGFFKPLKITGWSELAAMPNATSHHQVLSDGAEPPSFVSLWGSVDGVETSIVPRTAVYGFSPLGQGAWTTLVTNGNSIPRAAYGLAVHPSGQQAYVVGGRTGNQDLRTVDLYSPLRKVAEQALVSMANARSDAAAAIVDDHLYAIGGRTAGVSIYSIERVKLDKAGIPTGEFASMAALQNARAGANALVQGKEIWIFGGGHRPVEVYDTLTNQTRFLTDAAGKPVGTPEAWSNALMIQLKDRVFFFGGEKEDGQAVDRVFEFAPSTKAWRELGPMPSITGEDPATRPLTRVAGFFHEGAFHVFGGLTLPGRRTSARVFRGATL